MKQPRPRIYWPNCQVCQFMKRHPDFRKQVKESSYFDPQGKESMPQVMKRWDNPFKMPNMYRHLQKHQIRDMIKAESEFGKVTVRLEDLDGDPDQAHLLGLDEVIAAGRKKLAEGNLNITAESLLKAVRIKAEIDEKGKDRKLDAIKMMTGVFRGKTDPGETGGD